MTIMRIVDSYKITLIYDVEKMSDLTFNNKFLQYDSFGIK